MLQDAVQGEEAHIAQMARGVTTLHQLQPKIWQRFCVYAIF
jgi:hypothetical protein